MTTIADLQERGERARTEPLDGSDRFHSPMDPARRGELEALLPPYAHPQLWSDRSLETMADRIAR
jgi:hypothetical protein